MVASYCQGYGIPSLWQTWNEDFEQGLAIIASLDKEDTYSLFN